MTQYAILPMAATLHCLHLYNGGRNMAQVHGFGQRPQVNLWQLTLGQMLMIPDLPSPEVMQAAGAMADQTLPNPLRYGYVFEASDEVSIGAEKEAEAEHARRARRR